MTDFALLSDASRYLLRHGFTAEAVSMALQKIGLGLGVDRVYIFENSVDPQTGLTLMSQRYEWSASEATPQIDNPALQDLPYRDGCPDWEDVLRRGEVINGFPRDMAPATRELLESQDILSILVCPILVHGDWWGFVGFDDCHSRRIWPPKERVVLQFLAKALAGALRNHLVPEQMPEVQRSLQASIDRCEQPPTP
ncbi:MAG: GAF domain-containing protein [Polyangiaceae bacterium]|nr:GAF domain-containing protein [Polyangiaceae bacterium]